MRHSSQPPKAAMEVNKLDHSAFYFNDGDLILISSAAGEQKYHFRVHKFLLSHHSSVFADMLHLSVASDSPTVDGTPAVTLDDKAEDLAGLLDALYNPASAWKYKRLRPDTPLQVFGLLRTCRKYQVDSIFTLITTFIERDWPRSLEEHDLLKAETEYWKARYRSAKEGKVDGLYFDDRFPEPASAILLAREFGCTSILPYAFLMLSRIDPRMDWDLARSSQGKPDPELVKRLAAGERSARWSLLSREDLIRLLTGKPVIQDVYQRVSSSPACTSCRSALEKWATEGAKPNAHLLDDIRSLPSSPYWSHDDGCGSVKILLADMKKNIWSTPFQVRSSS
ncbi:hypothetical protein EIP91_010295 [Steccherinum ochraceum]|uniref:BTB domain-containing protein n=1 Tax=Steccherinum ochraceum TaxID=92696 RepID=A0A4R0RJ48_9APHY|nr:hypothetical protein EIP91_010295 [Steccherinum ochraceum]